MLPPCAQELASNCSQIYITFDKGRSWRSAAANVGVGGLSTLTHPGHNLHLQSFTYVFASKYT
jgi:hypothetical protein